jgi:hypothetical protein
VFVELCGTLPGTVVDTLPTVELTVFLVAVLYVLVLGAASGAEDDNKPATNLSISETSVFLLKLLK